MDLHLLPLIRREGKDLSNLPGLQVAAPPRRPARGRQTDRLIIYFILEGITPFSSEQLSQLLTRLTQTYYATPGSVTAAMRAVVEKLNDTLLERNLRSSASGQQGNGLLALVTLRGDQLILGQCGPMQAFLIQGQSAKRLLDPETGPRGLGMSKAASIHYSQVNLTLNDTLILTHLPSPAWNEAVLISALGQGLEGIRRRLFGPNSSEFRAVILQAKNGPGKVHLLQPQSSSIQEPLGPASNEGDTNLHPGQVKTTGRQEPVRAVLQEQQDQAAGSVTSGPTFTPAPGPQTISDVIPSPAARPAAAVRPEPAAFNAASTASAQAPSSAPATAPSRSAGQPGRKILPSARRALSGILGGLARSTGAVAQRMLPGEGVLPSSVMAFLAVAVPLAVVTVATVVYFQRGRAAQYQTYYSQAVQAAQEAQSQTDQQARRNAWGTVIAYLDRAEAYGTTPESRELRSQAQTVFDEMEGIRRINFEPAISGGVPRAFQITKMAATENDLYFLDSATGNVARAVQAGQVYEMDNSFQCGPSLPVGQATGQIIDIAPLPKGNEAKATVLAMDGQGNLLHCIPGEQPVLDALAPPPTNWGKPIAFAYDLGNLYVLDPQTNAVWVYWGEQYSSQPQFFFSEGVPPMQDVIDLAVDKNDLYLLHSDGHITLCTFSNLGVSPTRCTDPFPYSDSRVGREGQILIPEAPFIQIRATQPPDPSLYLLQADTQAIYHFSLRLLTFQRQLRSQNPLPANSPATAFAIRPDGRLVFMALGNRIYYAGMP